jgi:hypothetical protein
MNIAAFHRLSPLIVLAALGCPEPPPDLVTPSQAPGNPAVGGGGAPAAGSGGAGDGTAIPEDPASSGARIPAGMRIEPPGFGLEKGEGPLLSGTLTFDGEVDGDLRVEILQSGGEGMGPQLLHAITLDEMGPWSITAPEGLGEVSIVGYLDRDQNGPSPEEPNALIEEGVVIDKANITGLHLVLTEKDPEEGKEGKGAEPGAEGEEGAEGEGTGSELSVATEPALPAPPLDGSPINNTVVEDNAVQAPAEGGEAPSEGGDQ